MTPSTRHLELSLLEQQFAISRLAAEAPIPSWASGGPFFSVTRTSDELSIVCEAGRVPAAVRSQPRWRAFKVHGPFALTEVGVLSALANPLAKANVSLFVISSFDTDYLFVASDTLSTAIEALEGAGHKIQRRNTE